jgi:hypothetical protein
MEDPFRAGVFWGVVLVGAAACSSSTSGSHGSVPSGSCHTGGTATGFYSAACNQCAQASCNAEVSNYAGSGWVQSNFGGDGACAALFACICGCYQTGDAAGILGCSTNCASNVTPACQAAQKTERDCLKAKCTTQCQ